jgi:hypothetical protein
MFQARREFKGSHLVKEAFYPYGIEGFVHVEEHRACQPSLAEVPCYWLTSRLSSTDM